MLSKKILYIIDIHPYKLVKTKLSRLMEMVGRHYALGYTLVRYKREVIMYILRYKGVHRFTKAYGIQRIHCFGKSRDRQEHHL